MTRHELTIKNYKGEEHTFTIPNILWGSIKEIKGMVKDKFDGLILITGMVGSGKSSLGMCIAAIWEHLHGRTLTLDNIHFKAENIVEFTDREDNETHVCMFDEAIQGGTGQDVKTKMGHLLKITLVTKRRKKHLYIFLVDEIQEYSKKIISRASLLINVRLVNVAGKLRRGYFKMYSSKELKEIYHSLKSNRIQSIEQYKNKKFNYRFQDYSNMFIDEKEYDDKKVYETKQTLNENTNPHILQRNKLIMKLLEEGKTQKEIAEIVGISRQGIGDIKSKMQQASATL